MFLSFKPSSYILRTFTEYHYVLGIMLDVAKGRKCGTSQHLFSAKPVQVKNKRQIIGIMWSRIILIWVSVLSFVINNIVRSILIQKWAIEIIKNNAHTLCATMGQVRTFSSSVDFGKRCVSKATRWECSEGRMITEAIINLNK